MTTSALIDLILNYTDNTVSSDTDNTARRARLLQYAQEVFEEVWYWRQWPFRARSGTVAVTATNNAGDLPADFADFGDKGGIYSGTIELEEISEEEMVAERQSGSLAFGPYICAVFGFNTTTLRKQLQVLTQPANITYTINYLAVAPTLVDATNNTNKLDNMPDQYHQTVILPGVAAKARVSIGDGRDFKDDYLRGLSNMVGRERPRKTVVRRMPLARGMW